MYRYLSLLYENNLWKDIITIISLCVLCTCNTYSASSIYTGDSPCNVPVGSIAALSSLLCTKNDIIYAKKVLQMTHRGLCCFWILFCFKKAALLSPFCIYTCTQKSMCSDGVVLI